MLAAWEAALKHWQGEPFNELGDWPPAILERARLIELWHDAVEQRCAAALNVRPAADNVAEAEAMVLAEPLRERRWALLMTALVAAGRRPDALRAYDRARRVLATELGISPGTELLQLHGALLRDDIEADVLRRTDRGNLPAAVASLIGRDEEVALVRGLLDDHRLVTLTGPGGVGESRLAIAAAEAVRERFAGGAWLVELAATSDTDAIDAVIASTLGIAPNGDGSAGNSVSEAIGDRALLVVLDNCEHRLVAVADVVSDLLARCPRLCILTTSREPLAVPGEQTRRVASLPVEGAATELFTARARESDVGFVPDEQVVATISRHLDGIPLAIELAAAQVRTLGIDSLAARLNAQFDLLPTPQRGRDERHRTVRTAIDWSYNLLDEPERVVFERLSTFAGRFELAAVDAVVNGGDVEGDTAVLLASLVDKSMIVADGAGAARFRMLEPLRQYARQRLDGRGETSVIAARHCRYYAQLAVGLADHRPWSDEITATRRITAARENFAPRARHRSSSAISPPPSRSPTHSQRMRSSRSGQSHGHGVSVRLPSPPPPTTRCGPQRSPWPAAGPGSSETTIAVSRSPKRRSACPSPEGRCGARPNGNGPQRSCGSVAWTTPSPRPTPRPPTTGCRQDQTASGASASHCSSATRTAILIRRWQCGYSTRPARSATRPCWRSPYTSLGPSSFATIVSSASSTNAMPRVSPPRLVPS